MHEKDLLRQNALLLGNIRRIKEYRKSVNELSPIIAHVKAQRRRNDLLRQYKIRIKSSSRLP